jgi:hypothetical protein
MPPRSAQRLRQVLPFLYSKTEEIKSRLKSGNACYHSVQNLLSSSLLSKNLKIKILFIIIFSGTATQRGLWPPRSRGFVITHNDAPHSVGLLWTSDQLVAETST